MSDGSHSSDLNARADLAHFQLDYKCLPERMLQDVCVFDDFSPVNAAHQGLFSIVDLFGIRGGNDDFCGQVNSAQDDDAAGCC